MTNKELLHLIGEIEDKHIEEALPIAKKSQMPLWGKILVAACICIVVGFGYNYLSPTSFESILINHPTQFDMGSANTTIQVEDYKAIYQEVYAVKHKLKAFIGNAYASVDSIKWYRVNGYENLKYLIREDKSGEVSLWQFDSFQMQEGENYTYGDVLHLIYNVDSADDIESITASPFNADNSPEGLEAQKKVGTHTYSDRDDILAIYNVVKDVICYGEGRENPADLTRFTYSFSGYLGDKDGIYGTRCISIKFIDGTTHDSWKYSALGGNFFEYGSIFTEPMEECDVYILNEIFNIK